MNEIPYKRIITVFSAIILMLGFFGGKEVHAQGRKVNKIQCVSAGTKVICFRKASPMNRLRGDIATTIYRRCLIC